MTPETGIDQSVDTHENGETELTDAIGEDDEILGTDDDSFQSARYHRTHV